VFDQDENRELELTGAVRNRAAGQSIPDALRQHVVDHYLPIAAHPQGAAFTRLVEATPALSAYAERMWTRHTASLAAAIADAAGVAYGDLACMALARFVLEIPALARGRQDPGPPSRPSSAFSPAAGNRQGSRPRPASGRRHRPGQCPHRVSFRYWKSLWPYSDQKHSQ
jgi:hypothetical protein